MPIGKLILLILAMLLFLLAAFREFLPKASKVDLAALGLALLALSILLGVQR